MENKKELWFDARKLTTQEMKSLIPLALNHGYEGIMIHFSQITASETWSTKINILIYTELKDIKDIAEYIKKSKHPDRYIVYSKDIKVLENPMLIEIEKGIWVEVNDKESMNHAIAQTNIYKNCIVDFKSDTNIPLELILAFSQKNHCKVCKKVNQAEDGWIATMTMEMGSYAVLLDTNTPNTIIELKSCMDKFSAKKIGIEKLKIICIKHIGMGDRVCIDTTSELKNNEGMIIGSTSTGGILVSSETHFLPYMDLRPFRVNAGAIHSYIFCENNTTKYLSELKAGDDVLAVDADGNTRLVSVGRIKMERRPLLLMRAISDSGLEVNTIVQDDWHIRVISENSNIKNSTLLKENDVVLGYTSEPGRHLGVKISESIVEK